MGLSSTLANALSGLTASSRSAEVISSNISNARTPGYARREVNLSPLSLGGTGAGVIVDSVTRSLNQSVLNDRRLAEAALRDTSAQAEFLRSVEAALGLPDDPGSLSGRIATFDSALIQAASRPDSQQRLQAVLTAAKDIAAGFTELTRKVQQSRMDADAAIASQVDELNRALVQIDELNADILAHRSAGRDATALMDHRQRLIDRVGEIVPVREIQGDRGQIALYTTGGAILLEGNPAIVGFAPVGVITADMSIGSGALSGLTINGSAIPSVNGGVLAGGSLGARFAIRDDLGPAFQAQFDALARDLIERFEAPAGDPTRLPGDPGLFTDAGSTFDPLIEAGLAGRITVNSLADPAGGGALWRLRDGLGAPTPGDVGASSILQSLQAVLSAPRVPLSGSFIGAGRSFGGLASDLLSQVAGDRQVADQRQAFVAARQSALQDLHLQDGVDTDAELQNLLLVEQSYAANARVIQTIDDLIQQLIGL